MKIQKNNKIISLLALVVFLGIGGWVVMANPFKVTDPNDPSFDPMEFKFEDYKDSNEFSAALNSVFRSETPKSKIDSIMKENHVCMSEKIPAGQLQLSNNKKAQPEWNDDNFYVEYIKKKNPDQTYAVVILFDGKTENLILLMSNIIGPVLNSFGSEINYPKWVSPNKSCIEGR